MSDSVVQNHITTPTNSAPSPKAPEHLNRAGCCIKYIEGKGRGVFASREIPAQTDIEISPVLFFTSAEYEEHGRFTVLDHYTFKWRDGRMALALGLGSLFNHSQTPNVSYKLEPETESVRYTTTRAIMSDEELCIFYNHSLWFQPSDVVDIPVQAEVEDDDWGGLSRLGIMIDPGPPDHPFLDGFKDELIAEEDLPFTRVKLLDDEAEDEPATVQTESAWVVDIPDLKLTGAMLKWLKHSGYDTPSLAHLKRIRKSDSTTTLLLSTLATTSTAPLLPEGSSMPEPYLLQVPRSAAMTPIALQHKTTFWPTVYAPRKKHELEPWSRGRARWAWEAMHTVIAEAKAAAMHGELPIAAHLPVPYDEETQQITQVTQAMTAHDTRITVSHPLRHAALNLVRRVADERAKLPGTSVIELTTTQTEDGSKPLCPTNRNEDIPAAGNGSHYLLTSLTVFLSHEPCIMCSMALLHSRVKEIFYLYPMKKTGGCGGVACLPKLPGVNHRFGIGRWKTGLEPSATDDLRVGEETDA